MSKVVFPDRAKQAMRKNADSNTTVSIVIIYNNREEWEQDRHNHIF